MSMGMHALKLMLLDLKKVGCLLLILTATAAAARGEDHRYFAGALGGLAQLSADHRNDVSSNSSVTANYGTANGPAMMIFFGRHFTDYVSAQITYGWNRNSLTLSSVGFDSTGGSSYQEMRSSSQQSVIADFMLYFRPRKSFARPYLSVGTGWTRLQSSLQSVGPVTGSPPMPPQEFSSSAPALRVAVGIDIFKRKDWAFRYSFAETIRSNVISKQLSPPGTHDLANFQNLFGITWQF